MHTLTRSAKKKHCDVIINIVDIVDPLHCTALHAAGKGDDWTPSLQVLKHRGAVDAVQISPDGTAVLTASANTVRVFDWTSNMMVKGKEP